MLPNQQNNKETTSRQLSEPDAYHPGQPAKDNTSVSNAIQIPELSLPKGGGAIQGMGEKFQVNPATGTGSLSVPIAMSPGRNGFTPELALSYDSGSGNGVFGLGWQMGLPSISHKTQKGLPKYEDAYESDVFILSGAEDLVPVIDDQLTKVIGDFAVKRYRPRVEGLFARIEKWTHQSNQSVFWRTITRDNITTIFGQGDAAKIYYPEDAGKSSKRVFQWLIEKSYDDKGNIIKYEYKSETPERLILPESLLPAEKNRPLSPQRYLKRVKYGNTSPFLIHTQDFDMVNWEKVNAWLFELLFDYGEHISGSEGAPNEIPSYAPKKGWLCRPDPFSSYRSGFDIRTYRLCRAIHVFHHMNEEGNYQNKEGNHLDEEGAPVFSFPIKSTCLFYDADPIATRLTGVKHCFYHGTDYADLPPVNFKYSEAKMDEELHRLPLDSYENLPQGIDGQTYQWTDLYGEGLSGILMQSEGAWYYKANEGQGQFSATVVVAQQPSMAELKDGRQQLFDIDGDGRLDLVVRSEEMNGYFPMGEDRAWEAFQAIPNVLRIDWNDPNLRLIDLTGDGFPDVLITEYDCLTWYASRAEKGHGFAQRVSLPPEEAAGPRVVFRESTQSVFLADMTGDGLTDIVRVRNGEICYWANRGYGRFSHRIDMNGAPRFDLPEYFDPKRLRLADIDGSGTTDLLYLGRNIIQYWINQSGNGWSETETIDHFPAIDALSQVNVFDLLGKGTACLVWSSPLPDNKQVPLRYIELMEKKPYLLTEVNNNLGTITRMQYAPSTKFYLADQRAGKPWITKLSFPVHVLERVETKDEISENHFVSTYAYHHGYFDGVEREFRGFGMVEQWDTEDYESLKVNTLFEKIGINWHGKSKDGEIADIPPVYTKTWFHTGAAGKVIQKYRSEYYDGDQEAWSLPAPTLPEELSPEELLEAQRALKGSLLRQETYARDEAQESRHPYAVTENSYGLRILQPKNENRHAVFFPHPDESLTYHYERNPGDPRIAHSANLQMDDYGNVTHAVNLVYPRRGEDHPKEQMRLFATLSENLLLHLSGHLDQYRHSLPAESRTFEVHNLKDRFEEQGGGKFDIKWLRNEFLQPVLLETAVHFAREIDLTKTNDYADFPAKGQPTLRLLTQNRQTYYNDELNGKSDFGSVNFLAVPFESYALTFTQLILDQQELGQRITPGLLAEAGYISGDKDALFGANNTREGWWQPGGYQKDHDKDHFYLPGEIVDALGNSYFTKYDKLDLFVAQTTDPLENQSTASYNYHFLQARQLTDPNGTTTKVAFDPRGMVIASAIIGPNKEGDELAGFKRLIAKVSDPESLKEILDTPPSHLGNATTWFYTDPYAWMRNGKTPPYSISLQREIHFKDPGGNKPDVLVQRAISYSDGFGREILTKVQAEEGLAPSYDENINLELEEGKPVLKKTEDRWVGNGRTIFNNKGKPVQQYEPFFDSHPFFTKEQDLVHFGVTPTMYYDPLGRNVRTEFPDGTLSRVVFSPWYQKTFDQNDTILEPRCLWYQNRISRQGDQDCDPAEIIAAQKASRHANTPTTQHLDTLGRPFVSIAHNRYLKNYKRTDSEINVFIPTHTFQDIEGNPLEIWDGRNSERLASEEDAIQFNESGQAVNQVNTVVKHGNQVMTYCYALGGLLLYENSMDAGETWTLINVTGNPVHTWTYQDLDRSDQPITIQTSLEYDALQRPTHIWVEMEDRKILAERLVYGENLDNINYAKGQLILHFDGAGLLRNTVFDFKGNLKTSSRQLADKDYSTLKNSNPSWQKIIPDWKSFEDLDNDQIAVLVDGNTPIDGLEREVFETAINYDALNRPTETTTADGSITRNQYNIAGLLEAVSVQIPWDNGNAKEKPIIKNIDYNAKGQREAIYYQNGVKTTYEYDAKTFRLKQLYTTRNNGTDVLQHIRYYYDPVGNITEIVDEAQPTIFNDNQKMEPRHQYTYDALYQLICATGRESKNLPKGQSDREYIPAPQSFSDIEVRNYRQYYRYDTAGNMVKMQHIAKGGSWTRDYVYEEKNNRLVSTSRGKGSNNTDSYSHDYRGNMTLPHLPVMTWDYKDQFVHTKKRGDGALFFTYDSNRQRVRKLWFTGDGLKESIYLGNYEIFRENSGNGRQPKEEIQTLHIQDDQQRICLLETKTVENRSSVSKPATHLRYQLNNHLGSAAVEVSEIAEIISYEEYHPYGSTALHARNSSLEANPKRYRYSGKEKDEATGLYYYGARYYVSWLGRWCSVDPDFDEDNWNFFLFVGNNPIVYYDPDGRKRAQRRNRKMRTKKKKNPKHQRQKRKRRAKARRERKHKKRIRILEETRLGPRSASEQNINPALPPTNLHEAARAVINNLWEELEKLSSWEPIVTIIEREQDFVGVALLGSVDNELDILVQSEAINVLVQRYAKFLEKSNASTATEYLQDSQLHDLPTMVVISTDRQLAKLFFQEFIDKPIHLPGDSSLFLDKFSKLTFIHGGTLTLEREGEKGIGIYLNFPERNPGVTLADKIDRFFLNLIGGRITRHRLGGYTLSEKKETKNKFLFHRTEFIKE